MMGIAAGNQGDIDAVRARIVQKRGVRYFVHPAGGRFLKPFRVNVVSNESVRIPRAHYEVPGAVQRRPRPPKTARAHHTEYY